MATARKKPNPEPKPKRAAPKKASPKKAAPKKAAPKARAPRKTPADRRKAKGPTPKPKPKARRAASLSGKPGPKKAPVELRLLRAGDPHKNRVGDPDLPQAEALDLDALPVDPPQPLTVLEREFWDWIVKFQHAQKVPWLHAPDAEYIMKVATIYSRAKQVRFELNNHLSTGQPIVMIDTGRPHPLLREEKILIEAYLKGLREMAMLTPARQVTGEDDKADALGDFAL